MNKHIYNHNNDDNNDNSNNKNINNNNNINKNNNNKIKYIYALRCKIYLSCARHDYRLVFAVVLQIIHFP